MSRLAVVFRLSLASLLRDRPALVLTFALPLVFFTIFAAVFGGLDRQASRPLAVGLVVRAEGVFTDELVHALRQSREPPLELTVLADVTPESARGWFAAGRFDAVVVVPPAFEQRIDEGETAELELYGDESDPLAAPAVAGALLQAVVRAAALLSEEGGADGDSAAGGEPVRIVRLDPIGDPGARPGGEDPEVRPTTRASIAFYAAGLGVLFLMISLTNRAGLILEEREDGTLERLLSTQLGLTTYLAGRAAFLFLLGLVQITAMFAWAAIAFDLALAEHLGGYTVMAVLSAASATAFAVLVVLLCRSREQLTAASIVVVLLLAAIGGNLFPRVLMPGWLQDLGWFTFNAWALDGFQQVFWYGSPVAALGRHALVLGATTLGCFALAAALARRWSRS